MSAIELTYAAVGGNRHTSAADWAHGLLAFGAGNNIALWNPEDESHSGITALLTGHVDAVNAVRFHETTSRRLIISGGADKTIRIWAPSHHITGYGEIQCLGDGHASINTISTSRQHDLFASGSADGAIRIWHFQDEKAKLVQSISLQPRYLPLATAISSLSNGDVVLAVAGTSSIIQLFVRGNGEDDFELQATLRGHEGWIRSLDFTYEDGRPESDLLLASASQDKYIRLWRFHQPVAAMPPGSHESANKPVAAKMALSNKAHQVGSIGAKYAVTFEALLIGHEDWIYTARWAPRSAAHSAPTLLSASADNSLSIWSADSRSGTWLCNTRLGEISSQKGSTTATGSTGGFWVGLWQPQGHSIVSLGRTGSWRRWECDTKGDIWLQQLGVSGHVQEVQGLAWSRDGSYLLSTSSDQTTRVHAEWRKGDTTTWHEFARPQIHGYDLNCIDTVNENRFISGADEKLLRVFDKPKAIDNLLARLSGAKATSTSASLPDAANIPVLGLSNKAVTAINDNEPSEALADVTTPGSRDGMDPASTFHKSTLELDRPPFEEHLARHTLWPEHEKLYGHGYEISAVAASNDGLLVATACKASSLDHAVIRPYETQDWREVKPPLTAHSLTVTGLAFSPDDAFLLSVGRDRQWAVFARDPNTPQTYLEHVANPKAHSRMILDCSWAPESAGRIFATAGRDKSVKLWKLADRQGDCVATISSEAAITAIAFAPRLVAGRLCLASGNENGLIKVRYLNAATLDIENTAEIPGTDGPLNAVNALRWRPMINSAAKQMSLASASDDSSVRIYSIQP